MVVPNPRSRSLNILRTLANSWTPSLESLSKDLAVDLGNGIQDNVWQTGGILVGACVRNRSHQTWANDWLSSSKSESSKVFKPYWVVYVKPWWQRCDIAVCEVKPVNKMCPPPIIDFVILGFQIQQMLMFLENQGIHDPYVLGILVEGFSLQTYYMDTKTKNDTAR
ncbi:unnamed protein product [Absidia cylindrospora]